MSKLTISSVWHLLILFNRHQKAFKEATKLPAVHAHVILNNIKLGDRPANGGFFHNKIN